MINLDSRIGRRLVGLIVAVVFSSTFSAAIAADMSIYTDGLANGWADWYWSSNRNFANTSPVHGGTNSIAVTVTSPWGALYLHRDTLIDTHGYSQISFWVHGGTAGGQKLQLSADKGVHNYPFSASVGTWTKVNVHLSGLGDPSTLSDLWWADATGAALPSFYLDDITLTMDPNGGGNPAPVAGPGLTVDITSGRHPISDDIYGINLLKDESLATQLRLSVQRWGGNSTSRYNWQNDTSNVGSDWYFENIPNDNLNVAALPDGSAFDQFIEQNRRTGARSLLTVPTLGWVAKRRTNGHPYDCGFHVSKYGSQQSTDPWETNCGNGKAASGSNLTGNDPADTSVEESPDFVAQWITHLV